MALPDNPISREEHYLSAIAGEETPLPAAPITREEHYLAKIAGEDVNTPRPVTRKEHYLDYIAEHGSGGVEVEALDVTENGTYTAPEGKAYSPVTVDVPNPSTGTLEIAENGTYDVTNYASAEVDVPAPALVTKNITANGTYAAADDDADDYSEVTVNVSGGGGGAWDGGVIFIDYDGTELERWPSTEVADKTALPDNPTNHPRLVAQGWNWTLAEVKDYIEDCPNADVWVGQMYKTASGTTEFDISLNKATGLTVTLNSVGEKDWGDGTQDELTSHTYEDYGDYTIMFSGSTISISGIPSSTCLVATHIGEKITELPRELFYYRDKLLCVTIHNGVSSSLNYTFQYAKKIENIIIPRSITDLSISAFSGCFSLRRLSLPATASALGTNLLNSNVALSSVCLPNGPVGIGFFRGCTTLRKIFIQGTATSISSYGIAECPVLSLLDFRRATSVVAANASDILRDSTNSQLKIIVPDALYDDWIVATNWAAYANYIYKASEVSA